MLKVEKLSKTFITKSGFFRQHIEEYRAVDDISFSLEEGEILGLLGSNGAGKTTTIKMLLGLLKPSSGNITYFGRDFYKYRSEILQDVSHASAYHKFPGTLSVERNLEIYARLYSLPYNQAKQRIEKFLAFFEIERLRHKLASTLSAGQMTRVMLAKAFLTHPKIVLLDEPTASLDPDIAKLVRAFILSQQSEYGVSVILTSHNMQEVADMCQRVLVMQRGVIIEEDSPQELAKRIALSKVRLRLLANREQAMGYLNQIRQRYTLVDRDLNIELDEAMIPELLQQLAARQVGYSHIEIEKPNLEDYFLKITEEGKL